MMMHMPLFVLENLFESQEFNLPGCSPGFCRPSARASARASGCSAPRTSPQAPKAQPKPVIQQPAEATHTVTRANFHELNNSYLIWADLPGLARQDISVTVNDHVLRITGQQKDHAAEDNASSHLLAALRARPRRAVDIKIPLKSDANLDGIQAKLANGELTIAIPKRVPQHFSVPVLGGDEKPSISAAFAPAQLPEPAQEAALPKPEQKSQETPAAAEETSIAEVPFPDVVAALKEHEREAEEAHADASVTSEAAAAAAEESAPAEHKPATAEGPESDGSWEDVSDEEREAERSARRRKGLLPPNGPVLDEVANEPAPSA